MWRGFWFTGSVLCAVLAFVIWPDQLIGLTERLTQQRGISIAPMKAEIAAGFWILKAAFGAASFVCVLTAFAGARVQRETAFGIGKHDRTDRTIALVIPGGEHVATGVAAWR